MIHDNSFDVPITNENAFKANQGGTEFGPVFQLAFEKMDQYIENKDYAKFFFFTDGCAKFPAEEI